jgi:hypothetical protein
MIYSQKSIALITYTPSASSEETLKYASGFFVETEQYGKVCVTCAHVVERHPGPDKNILYVNDCPTSVCFNGNQELGVDVALLKVPQEVLDSGVHFHKLGRSASVNKLYYSHGWSLPRGQSFVELSKVWGPRLDYSTAKTLRRGSQMHTVWRLRNDVPDKNLGRSFSTSNFSPGWSGAPVFNVRRNIDDHRVIGVLSVVAQEEGEAIAVSVELLDFLRPSEEQTEEGWVCRAPENPLRHWIEKLTGRSYPTEYILSFSDEEASDDQLYNVRFSEITQQPVSPPSLQPPSPYDLPRKPNAR